MDHLRQPRVGLALFGASIWLFPRPFIHPSIPPISGNIVHNREHAPSALKELLCSSILLPADERIAHRINKLATPMLMKFLTGRRSTRDDVTHRGTATPQLQAETDQEPLQFDEQAPGMVNVNDLEAGDIVIAVMGPTGSGKSTLVSAASGLDTSAIGHALKSHTNQVNAIKFWDSVSRRHVVLVDTPGFNDTFKSDTEILTMISNWLVSSYGKKKLLSGILYLHRITDNRVAGTSLKNLRVFRKLCGRDALDKVYLTATMWDEVDAEVGLKRLEELKAEYWKTMIIQGARIASCRSDDDSSKRLVRQIILSEQSKRNEVAQGGMVSPQHPAETGQGRSLHAPDTKKPLTTDEAQAQVAQGPSQVSSEPDVVNLEADDILIAIVGPTASGKTTLVRSASGHSTEPNSSTDQITPIKFWDQMSMRHVVLVDTPGFDDTSKSEFDVLNMISDWLVSSFNQRKLLSGILYLHPITDNRVAGAPRKNLRIFRRLCGKDGLDRVYLTTTMWDAVDPNIGEKNLEDLKTRYWKQIIDHGAQTARCRKDDGSSKKLIRQILAQETPRKVLLIQEEMAELKMELKETAAGQQLYDQLETLVEKQMMLLRRIDKERKAASDAAILAELQTEYSDLRAQIDDQLRQMQELKLPWLRRFFARRLKLMDR